LKPDQEYFLAIAQRMHEPRAVLYWRQSGKIVAFVFACLWDKIYDECMDSITRRARSAFYFYTLRDIHLMALQQGLKFTIAIH